MKIALPIFSSWVAASLLVQVNRVEATPANPIETVDNDNVPDNFSQDTYVQKQIEWLKSKERGYFSPKIVHRNIDDPNTPSGMFAL